MNFKKILNILIFFAVLLITCNANEVFAVTDIEVKKKEAREQINRLKWLESLETNKLYKNQQKLEKAKSNLESSKSGILIAQKELSGLEEKLSKASIEYTNLNSILARHVRTIYKSQRKILMEVLLTSNDINTFLDRIHYQRIILKADYERMDKARSKAREIALLKYSIESRKNRLENSIASINSQQNDIKKAIAKNESMIHKLKTDRIEYEKAEKELAKQSASIESYINKKTTSDSSVTVASGFMRPIQGRITSPFGWRTHPIFNSRSFHSGIDIGGPNLGAIRASNSGKVIYSGWYGGYGKVVILEHGMVNGKPITTLYAH